MLACSLLVGSGAVFGQQIPTIEAAPLDQATMKQRMNALRAKQAEFTKKMASGEAGVDAAQLAEFRKAQASLLSIRAVVEEMNQLEADDPKLAPLQSSLLTALPEVAMYLRPSDHPKYEARTMTAEQVAETERIEGVIESMTFGKRSEAEPVKVSPLTPPFTLVNLPVPIILETKPQAKIYLSADNGGVFSNGLSLIELQADEAGLVQTWWVSIGEAVAKCQFSIFSQVAIETETFHIDVVSLSILPRDNLPVPKAELLKNPVSAQLLRRF